MPVCLHRDPFGYEMLKRTNGLLGSVPVEFRESDSYCIDIGLVNNMPDAALQSTERQFLTLIDSAASGMTVRLSLFALPDIPRTDAGRFHIGKFYSGIDSLWDSQLDGLIVTGAEPRAPNLTDEPYWGSLTRVLEWADQSTRSTVLSCLSAHAALLHLDGIGRHRHEDKRLGVFECCRVSDHHLMSRTPSHFPVPHSRWNGISQKELSACGYLTLTRAVDAGVDMFVKQRKSLFVFFQGHPEYEANSLLLEYRRDVWRYLRREIETYPEMPQHYFDANTSAILTAFRERALHDGRDLPLSSFPTAHLESGLANTWRSAASRVWSNWLTCLRAKKEWKRSPLYRRRSSFLGGAG